MAQEPRDLDGNGHIFLASVIFDFVFLLAFIAAGVYVFVMSIRDWPLFGIFVAGFIMVAIFFTALTPLKKAGEDFKKWRVQK